jgi:hypothetical protein
MMTQNIKNAKNLHKILGSASQHLWVTTLLDLCVKADGRGMIQEPLAKVW